MSPATCGSARVRVQFGQAQGQAFELLAQGGCSSGAEGEWRRHARPRRRARHGAGRPLTARRRRGCARLWRRNRRDTVCASCSRCSPSAACSSASVPCSIFCVRPLASASSTRSTSARRGQQLARARHLGAAPVVGLAVQRLDQRHRGALVQPVGEALHAGVDDGLGLLDRGLALLAGGLHQRRQVVHRVEVDVGQARRPRARCRAARPGRP